jgi:hypothetical protein
MGMVEVSQQLEQRLDRRAELVTRARGGRGIAKIMVLGRRREVQRRLEEEAGFLAARRRANVERLVRLLGEGPPSPES